MRRKCQIQRIPTILSTVTIKLILIGIIAIMANPFIMKKMRYPEETTVVIMKCDDKKRDRRKREKRKKNRKKRKKDEEEEIKVSMMIKT